MALVLVLAMAGWPSSEPGADASAEGASNRPAALTGAPGESALGGAGQPNNNDGRAAAPSSAMGWVGVSSEVPVRVYADGELLGSMITGRFQLQAGDHYLVLTNDAVGYRLAQKVRIRAGRTMHLAVTLAREPADGAAPLVTRRPK